jgi:hypothetical protein
MQEISSLVAGVLEDLQRVPGTPKRRTRLRVRIVPIGLVMPLDRTRFNLSFSRLKVPLIHPLEIGPLVLARRSRCYGNEKQVLIVEAEVGQGRDR